MPLCQWSSQVFDLRAPLSIIIFHILIKTTDKLGHELYLLCLHALHNTSHLFPFSGKLFDGLTNCIIFAVAVIHASRPLLTLHFFLSRLLATEQTAVVGVAQPAELELLGASAELVTGLFSELLQFCAACVPACSMLLHVMISRQPRKESIMS